MDVSRAQVHNLDGHRIEFVDPDSPFQVQVRMDPNASRPTITELTVRSRGSYIITSSTLASLPVRQIASVAASELKGEGEALYRMLAQPRPRGARSWPSDHFERVNRVASWARSTGRPGGAAGAVAEFWGVHYRTARRWIANQP